MGALTSVLLEDVARVADELETALRPLAGSTLLVSGGGGFLCSYFLDVIAYLNDRAWASGCRIVCMDNFRSGAPARIAHLQGRPDVVFLAQDVSEPYSGPEEVHWIIHGASIASPPFYRRFPLETIDANVTGTRRMLELGRRDSVRGLLYLSTSEVYGDPEPGAIPTPENYRGRVSSTGPRACYDESKRLAETLCSIYHRLYGVPVKIVRPFNVYGPGQRLDDGRVIPDLMAAALERRSLVLHSDGRATRTFCYVTDAIRAMLTILVSAAIGEIFNVGNDGEEVRMLELAERLREIAGPPRLEIEHVASRDGDYLTDNPQRRCPDLRKLRGAFAWEPKTHLSEGLARTLASFREQKARAVVRPEADLCESTSLAQVM